MAAGFRVIGSAGTIQIDANYKNFELLETGTLYITGVGGASTGYVDISVPTGETFPVIALRGPYRAWSLMSGTNTYRVYASGATSMHVIYYIFGTPKPTTGGGGVIGLRVRNGTNNQIAYSSERKYMKVLERRSGTLLSQGDSISGDITGKDVAIAVQNRPYEWRRRTVNQGQSTVQISIFTGRGLTSGGSYSYDFNSFGNSAFPGNLPTLNYIINDYNILILDVSGL